MDKKTKLYHPNLKFLVEVASQTQTMFFNSMSLSSFKISIPFIEPEQMRESVIKCALAIASCNSLLQMEKAENNMQCSELFECFGLWSRYFFYDYE